MFAAYVLTTLIFAILIFRVLRVSAEDFATGMGEVEMVLFSLVAATTWPIFIVCGVSVGVAMAAMVFLSALWHKLF